MALIGHMGNPGLLLFAGVMLTRLFVIVIYFMA
jgi:hypothetical protein